MRPMPMLPNKIQSQPYLALRTELSCQIDRLKPAVAAVRNKSRRGDLNSGCIRTGTVAQFDKVQFESLRRSCVWRYFHTCKVPRGLMMLPPHPVGGIKRVSPWRELIRIVHHDNPAAAFQLVDSLLRRRFPASDYCCNLS